MPEEAEETTADDNKLAFQRLRDGLLAEHDSKFALLHGGELAGIFDSMDAAYEFAVERFGEDRVFIGRISKTPEVQRAPALRI